MSRVLGVEAGGSLEVDRHFGGFCCVGLFCVMRSWLVMKGTLLYSVLRCVRGVVVWCDALSV